MTFWTVLWLLVTLTSFVLLLAGLWSFDLDWTIGTGFIGMFIGIMGLLFLMSNEGNMEHDRLMRQCMADNHPEYECVSKLKQDVVPVFIPVGARDIRS